MLSKVYSSLIKFEQSNFFYDLFLDQGDSFVNDCCNFFKLFCVLDQEK